MGCSNNPSININDDAKWQIIFVLGSPGGGKGTQCDKIKEKYQIFHYSCGELLRQAAKAKNEEADLINSYMKEGKIVPARITCELQKKCMEKNDKEYRAFLCDGFPRNEENLKFFFEVMGKDIKVLCTLFLSCPEDVCIERIQKRGEGRVDDNIETVKKRFKSLKEETIPTVNKLKGYGPVYEIKANQTIENVFKDIDEKFSSKLVKEEVLIRGELINIIFNSINS